MRCVVHMSPATATSASHHTERYCRAMYQPAHRKFEVEDAAALLTELCTVSPATLVTHGPDGFRASILPMLFDPDDGPNGTLRGHLARATEAQPEPLRRGHRRRDRWPQHRNPIRARRRRSDAPCRLNCPPPRPEPSEDRRRSSGAMRRVPRGAGRRVSATLNFVRFVDKASAFRLHSAPWLRQPRPRRGTSFPRKPLTPRRGRTTPASSCGRCTTSGRSAGRKSRGSPG